MALWIELSARSQEKIDWKEAIAKASNASGQIFWVFDLGLEDPAFPIDDEMRLHELSLALKHFSETLFPRFEEKTVGAALYRGPLDLGGRQQKEELPLYLDTYAAYFQLLAHKLPDSLSIFILFDATGIPRTEALSLLSKDRFSHFELGVKGLASASWCLAWEGENLTLSEAKVGVVLPQEYDAAEFEQLLQELDANATTYRVVSEAFMTEEWDGLETMISPPLSARGNRMLKGFLASGGQVEIRGRGIRTPDLLVPNQPR